ncbi:hypothetical protein H632_c43p1 [Helicosporidium sp. ATCC 50920]|nr:hypothetical protein H632_c43p1 [Helicosporidium sp. ATCC 50920]|eukprot:KDD77004.1 hypothetical protein H632_c43p1 [Helicosporidium sp. ATCC 50920]
MHGLLSVGAAGYLWYSGRAPATPHSSLYCYDRVASWFLCGHTGFLLHELIFYARYNKLLTPQFPMHMIHHVVFLLAIVMVEMAPLSAHITFLPWYELSNVSGLAYGLYGAALLLKWPRDKQAMAVRAGLGAALFKAVAGGVVAVRLLSHLQSDKPWKRAQSEGEEKILKIAGFVGMSTAIISALIFVLWFQQLLARSSQFLNAISRLSRGLSIDPPSKRAADKADKKADKKAGKKAALVAPSPRLNKKKNKA